MNGGVRKVATLRTSKDIFRGLRRSFWDKTIAVRKNSWLSYYAFSPSITELRPECLRKMKKEVIQQLQSTRMSIRKLNKSLKQLLKTQSDLQLLLARIDNYFAFKNSAPSEASNTSSSERRISGSKAKSKSSSISPKNQKARRRQAKSFLRSSGITGYSKFTQSPLDL